MNARAFLIIRISMTGEKWQIHGRISRLGAV